MTIDNIPLTAFVCTNLFKDNLVLPPNSLVTQIPSDKKGDEVKADGNNSSFSHLGLNGKKILFLINHPNAKYLPDEEMDMLTKLLGACRLSMADIALVNYHHSPGLIYTDLISQLESQKLLIFGVTPKQLGLPFNIPEFQIQPYENKTFLFTPTIQSFLTDIGLKKSLWESLQKLFLL